MPLGREQVERAARLARLALDDETTEQLVSELSRIIDYVAVLEEAAGGADELVPAPEDVVRDDVPGGMLDRSEALANAARTRSGCFEVPGFLPDASSPDAESRT